MYCLENAVAKAAAEFEKIFFYCLGQSEGFCSGTIARWLGGVLQTVCTHTASMGGKREPFCSWAKAYRLPTMTVIAAVNLLVAALKSRDDNFTWVSLRRERDERGKPVQRIALGKLAGEGLLAECSVGTSF